MIEGWEEFKATFPKTAQTIDDLAGMAKSFQEKFEVEAIRAAIFEALAEQRKKEIEVEQVESIARQLSEAVNRKLLPPVGKLDGLELAMKFHDTYERLAPSFGYETREDTRTFDPDSKNGKLMVAVCSEILFDLGRG